MKRLVLITAVLLFAKSFCGDLYAQMSEEEHLKSILEPDTVFVVYLEADTLPRGYTVFLVFENITGDSILLFSNFKLYRYGFAPGWGRGFAMNFYLNGGDKPLMPNWGQWDEEVFKFSDDKHDGKILMPPHSIIRFRIPLPSPAGSSKKWELSFSINYIYVNPTKKNGRFVSMETNRLDLGYLDRRRKQYSPE